MSSVFICHSSADKPFVRQLKEKLQTFGVQVWVDEDELPAGASLIKAIASAIEQMAYFAVVLSPKSVRSRWCNEELELAMTNQLATADIRIIPILLRKCELPLFLRPKKYIDLTRWVDVKSHWERRELLDRATKAMAVTMGIDPREGQRWSGDRLIRLGDFRRRLQAYFAPRTVIVEYSDREEGIMFVRVEDDKGFFQLYDYWSKPSYIDLANKVFRGESEPSIAEITCPQAIAWTEAESEAAIEESSVRYGITSELFNQHPPPDEYRVAWTRAHDDYQAWVQDQTAISLVVKQETKRPSEGDDSDA